ncbi:ATP-grasp domain-containing protein [Roseateles sp. BYS78W]|uniref:ATP-grasp domain-containing protein n=1 Tax=Pelomonas candidula TaxID=3299025 RepID=A0ABW7HIC1_9BURK
MTSSPTLLITAAGTGVGWAYALTLSQHMPGVRLITADTNGAAWCSAARLSTLHLQWPPFEAGDAYLAQLNALIDAEGVTHYLPIIDPEIAWAARERGRLRVELLGPDDEFAKLALAKDQYAARLATLGVDSPRTLGRSDIEAGTPGFAKLPGSFGGRAAWPIQRAEQLDTLPAGAFVQEALPGAEYTVDCFPTGDDDIVICSVRERVETKSGVCTKARIAPNPILRDYARKMVQGFSLTTPFCFQAIASSDGQRLAVTDINPRLGAGTLMSAANGTDFFAAHLARTFGHSWREHLRPHHLRCAVTRQYFELLTPEVD